MEEQRWEDRNKNEERYNKINKISNKISENERSGIGEQKS